MRNWTEKQDEAIKSTGGKYAELATLAEWWGMPSATVSNRWLHFLRDEGREVLRKEAEARAERMALKPKNPRSIQVRYRGVLYDSLAAFSEAHSIYHGAASRISKQLTWRGYDIKRIE